MRGWKHDVSLRIVKFLAVCLMALPFGLCWELYYANRTAISFSGGARLCVLLLFVFVYVFFGRTFDAFLVSFSRVSELAFSQMLAACMADGVLYLLICFLSEGLRPLWAGLQAILCQGVAAVLWAYLANKWYFHTYPPKRTYIVYDVRLGLDGMVKEYGLSRKFKVEKVLQAGHVLRDLSTLDGAEIVFTSGIHSSDRNVILKYCVARNIRLLVLPRIGDVIMDSAAKLHILHLPIYTVSRYNPKPEFLLIKRTMDILLSAVALILTGPLFLIVAMLVRRDGGPAFYRQDRLTKDGKIFRVIKFRSMRVDAEKDGVARLSAGEDDERITAVGRVIRNFRIDELPQLLNILKGDMSIVGPRPERPEIAAQYEAEIPEFRLRLQCKAGLTGYAQVFGKYNTTPYDKLLMDLMYISDPGVIQDMRIIFSTVKTLFMPESTEGVKKGSVTALDQPTEGEDPEA